MIEAWLSASEMITVRSSASVGIAASFAFQQETYESAASVSDSSASSRSSSRCGANVPQMKRTDAVPAQPLDPGFDYVGMVREAEIVVRGEDDHLAAFGHPHHRALRRLEHVEVLVRPSLAQPAELAAQLLLQCAHAAASAAAAHGCRTILQASPLASSSKASAKPSKPTSAVINGRRSTTPCSSR